MGGAVNSASPAVPRGFAARVWPAGSAGHWADVLALADGRTGVLLGCCPDPVLADRVRTEARDGLRRSADPVAALHNIGDTPVSAVCAVIDATTIRYASHGDGAVLVPGDRTAPPTRGPLVVASLAPGAMVLLSTSPLPGAAGSLNDGAALHPDQLADRIVADADARGAAVLYRCPPGPMSVALPAVPASLAVIRGRLRQWLATAGVDPETCADVLLAVGEATANSAEHSVVGAERQVNLAFSVALDGNALRLKVSDDGRWKPAAVSQGYRGHGMHLINALVDSVELTATPDGTTVEMHKELP